MKIVFVSNYFNHHQKPLSDALYTYTEGQYNFIAVTSTPKVRKELGYGMDPVPPYVLTAFTREQWDNCVKTINEADVVIAGSAPESMLKERIKAGKLLFRYSERPLKTGFSYKKYIPRLIKWHWRNPPGKPIYMLCASAYTASDYAKFGLFRKKSYKWGYFPETKRYDDVDKLMDCKDTKSILWVGRFLNWKRPHDVIEVAQRLHEDGYDFTMTMIGIGEMELQLRYLIEKYGLQDRVILTGSMQPRQVREYMEKAGIFLFTSNRMEGWGVVLNEAMNSGCTAIASIDTGSTPYLIDNEKNGFVYRSGDIESLYQKVKYLLDNPQEQSRIGREAYCTIIEEWNAENAAKRLMELADRIINGEKSPDVYVDGPCSRARNIGEG